MSVLDFTIAMATAFWPFLFFGVLLTVLAIRDLYRWWGRRQKRKLYRAPNYKPKES